jgi:hypothetical protein
VLSGVLFLPPPSFYEVAITGGGMCYHIARFPRNCDLGMGGKQNVSFCTHIFCARWKLYKDQLGVVAFCKRHA